MYSTNFTIYLFILLLLQLLWDDREKKLLLFFLRVYFINENRQVSLLQLTISDSLSHSTPLKSNLNYSRKKRFFISILLRGKKFSSTEKWESVVLECLCIIDLQCIWMYREMGENYNMFTSEWTLLYNADKFRQ